MTESADQAQVQLSYRVTGIPLIPPAAAGNTAAEGRLFSAYTVNRHFGGNATFRALMKPMYANLRDMVNEKTEKGPLLREHLTAMKSEFTAMVKDPGENKADIHLDLGIVNYLAKTGEVEVLQYASNITTSASTSLAMVSGSITDIKCVSYAGSEALRRLVEKSMGVLLNEVPAGKDLFQKSTSRFMATNVLIAFVIGTQEGNFEAKLVSLNGEYTLVKAAAGDGSQNVARAEGENEAGSMKIERVPGDPKGPGVFAVSLLVCRLHKLSKVRQGLTSMNEANIVEFSNIVSLEELTKTIAESKRGRFVEVVTNFLPQKNRANPIGYSIHRAIQPGDASDSIQRMMNQADERTPGEQDQVDGNRTVVLTARRSESASESPSIERDTVVDALGALGSRFSQLPAPGPKAWHGCVELFFSASIEVLEEIFEGLKSSGEFALTAEWSVIGMAPAVATDFSKMVPLVYEENVPTDKVPSAIIRVDSVAGIDYIVPVSNVPDNNWILGPHDSGWEVLEERVQVETSLEKTIQDYFEKGYYQVKDFGDGIEVEEDCMFLCRQIFVKETPSVFRDAPSPTVAKGKRGSVASDDSMPGVTSTQSSSYAKTPERASKNLS